MGLPIMVFPLRAAAFSHASVFQNSAYPLMMKKIVTKVSCTYLEYRLISDTKNSSMHSYHPLKSPESL